MWMDPFSVLATQAPLVVSERKRANSVRRSNELSPQILCDVIVRQLFILYIRMYRVVVMVGGCVA